MAMKILGLYISVIIIVVFSLLSYGCHESVPRPEYDVDNPTENIGTDDPDKTDDPSGGGDRPPVGDDDDVDIDGEIRDTTPRFVYGDMSLRFNRPGVLVKSFRGDNHFEFYDIDGNDRVIISWQGVGLNDKILRDVSVEVNGRQLEIDNLREISADQNCIWLYGHDRESKAMVIVVKRY